MPKAVFTENKPSEKWTVEKLKALGTNRLLSLYKSLPAPSVREMEGEYKGHYLGADHHPISDFAWYAGANWTLAGNTWRWIGKSFKPISDKEGSGHNNQRKFGMRLRKWPMRTSIVSSRYDEKDAFFLDYTYYYSLAGVMHMQDEVRKLSPGLYLETSDQGDAADLPRRHR